MHPNHYAILDWKRTHFENILSPTYCAHVEEVPLTQGHLSSPKRNTDDPSAVLLSPYRWDPFFFSQKWEEVWHFQIVTLNFPRLQRPIWRLIVKCFFSTTALENEAFKNVSENLQVVIFWRSSSLMVSTKQTSSLAFFFWEDTAPYATKPRTVLSQTHSGCKLIIYFNVTFEFL